jgi:hypothetical protein
VDTTTVFIPEIPMHEMSDREKRIKPVVQFKDGDRYAHFYIMPVDIFGTAYTWEPKKDVKAENLVVLGRCVTYHRYGHPMFFKPSIAEVLAQVPKEYLHTAVAFEIVGPPESADDLNQHTAILNAGYHMAITQFYGRNTCGQEICCLPS